jgi:spore coat polysaccharide biosynthesis protein SpsF
MKIVATIEARMTSSRLPGKVMLKVLNKPILSYLVERLKTIKCIDEIILATTTNKTDDVLEIFAKEYNISCFRGSENNVLDRVINAGKKANADIIVEITGDCPIIDPSIVDQTIKIFINNNVHYVSNNHIRSYPDGMDVQVFKLQTLINSSKLTNDELDQEHVTLFIRNHPELFSKINLIAPFDLHWPELGITLDEESDFELLKKIIENFENKNKNFSCHDIIEFLISNPSLLELNKTVLRKGDN